MYHIIIIYYYIYSHISIHNILEIRDNDLRGGGHVVLIESSHNIMIIIPTNRSDVLGCGDDTFDSNPRWLIFLFSIFRVRTASRIAWLLQCRSVLNGPRDASLCIAHARVDAWCVVTPTGLCETEPTAIEPLQREFRALTMISTRPLKLFVRGLCDVITILC